MPTGRPSKLTPELQEEICGLLAQGNYVETAAHLVGISKRTIFLWIKKGQAQKRGRFREFFRAVSEAQATAENNLREIIDTAAKRDWRAAAWRLERQYPERYGPKQTITHDGETTHKVGLSDAVADDIRAKILGVGR